MECNIKLPVDIGDKIWCIHNNKVNSAFIEGYDIEINKNKNTLTKRIVLKLNRYNNTVDFYQFEKHLDDCFKTKQELINSL